MKDIDQTARMCSLIRAFPVHRCNNAYQFFSFGDIYVMLTIPKIGALKIINALETFVYYSVMCPNNADGMANNIDPDQTAPLGAV